MKNKRLIDNLFRIAVVIFTSSIYSLCVLWFLEPANLISIGMTGLAQIVTRALSLIDIHIPIGVFSFLFNLPLIIVGIKYVSKRFVLFSFLSVGVQSFWMLGWDWIYVDFGFDPNDVFFLAVLAGVLCGFGIGLALRYGTSTGGFDIIGQALSLKKNISIGLASTIFNVVLAIIGGGIMQNNWMITIYTIIFVIMSSLVVDKIHTSYNYLRIDIISKYPEEVAQALLSGINRGCTILDVKGGYTKESKADVFMIISSYELQKAADIVRYADPGAFMTVSPIKRIFGKFFKHIII